MRTSQKNVFYVIRFIISYIDSVKMITRIQKSIQIQSFVFPDSFQVSEIIYRKKIDRK